METIKVYIEYKESSSGGEHLTDEMWSDRSDLIKDFQLQRASMVRTDPWHCEEFDINCSEPPDDVYVVLVRYKSGDTFGNSYGNGHIEGVFTDKDLAMEITSSIERDTYVSNRGYLPWKGYFERLESVECFVMKLHKLSRDSKMLRRID